MRVIGADVVNEMLISCTISGEELLFEFRTPTSQERQQYFAGMFRREGGDVRDNSSENRLKWGKEIISGIGENQIAYQSANGPKPLSSNEKNENSRADWKDLLVQYAPDLVEFLAIRIFEGQRQVPKPKTEYDSKN